MTENSNIDPNSWIKKEMLPEMPKKSHVKTNLAKIPTYLAVVSDSLYLADEETRRLKDKSGKIARSLLEEQLSDILEIAKEITYLPDDILHIRNFILHNQKSSSLFILMGGTGIARRDVTIEAVKTLFEKVLDGFGELFRLKTYEEVGTVSIMTRAMAGIYNESLILCLPGSPNAVKLGINLIIPEIKHIFSLIQK